MDRESPSRSSAPSLIRVLFCCVSRSRKNRKDLNEETPFIENDSTKHSSNGSQVSNLVARFETLAPKEEKQNSHTRCSQSSFIVPKSKLKIRRVCQEKVYPTETSIIYAKQTFHAACFKCQLCCNKVQATQVAEIIPMSNSASMIVCSRCHTHSTSKYLPHHKGTPSNQTTVVSTPERGNVKQVKNEIGDDLESVMDGMIPRCNICGGHFLGDLSRKMTVVGVHKYHQECWTHGKPMVERTGSSLSPIQAAKYAPQYLIVRLTTSSSNAKPKVSTLFFVIPSKTECIKRLRKNGGDDSRSVSFQYQLDPKAPGNPTCFDKTRTSPKKAFPFDEESTKVEVIGDPFGIQVNPTGIALEKEKFCGSLQCQKFQLLHRIKLEVASFAQPQASTTQVNLSTASLILDISRI